MYYYFICGSIIHYTKKLRIFNILNYFCVVYVDTDVILYGRTYAEITLWGLVRHQILHISMYGNKT